MRISHIGLVAGVWLSTAALADPTPHDLTLKVDNGQVRQLNLKAQTLVCDLPDGQITYNIAGAPLIDATGTVVAVSAAKLPVGQWVQVEYRVQPNIEQPDHGAHVTALRLPPAPVAAPPPAKP